MLPAPIIGGIVGDSLSTRKERGTSIFPKTSSEPSFERRSSEYPSYNDGVQGIANRAATNDPRPGDGGIQTSFEDQRPSQQAR